MVQKKKVDARRAIIGNTSPVANESTARSAIKYPMNVPPMLRRDDPGRDYTDIQSLQFGESQNAPESRIPPKEDFFYPHQYPASRYTVKDFSKLFGNQNMTPADPASALEKKAPVGYPEAPRQETGPMSMEPGPMPMEPDPAPAAREVPPAEPEEQKSVLFTVADGIDIRDLTYAKEGGRGTPHGQVPHQGDYNYKRSSGYHHGLDIAMRNGTEVHWGMSDLRVTEVGEKFDPKKHKRGTKTGANGNLVRMMDPNGYEVTFIHLKDQVSLKVGDKVKAGELIGYSGNTGYNSAGSRVGYHLHIQVKDPSGKIMDPREYVKQFKGAGAALAFPKGDNKDGAGLGVDALGVKAPVPPEEMASHISGTDDLSKSLQGLDNVRLAAANLRKKMESSKRESEEADSRFFEATQKLRIEAEARADSMARAARQRESFETEQVAAKNKESFDFAIKVAKDSEQKISNIIKKKEEETGNSWALFGFKDKTGENIHLGKTAFTVAAAIGLVANAWASISTSRRRRPVPFIAGDLIRMAINTDLAMQGLDLRRTQDEVAELSEAAKIARENADHVAVASSGYLKAIAAATQAKIEEAKTGATDLALVLQSLGVSLENGETVELSAKGDSLVVKTPILGRDGVITGYKERPLDVNQSNTDKDGALSITSLYLQKLINRQVLENRAKYLKEKTDLLSVEGSAAEKVLNVSRAEKKEERAHERWKIGQDVKIALAQDKKKVKTKAQKRLSNNQSTAILVSRDIIAGLEEYKSIVRRLYSADSGTVGRFFAQTLAKLDYERPEGEEMNSWLLRTEGSLKSKGVSNARDYIRLFILQETLSQQITKLVETGNLNKAETALGKFATTPQGELSDIIGSLDRIEDRLLTRMATAYLGGTDEDRSMIKMIVGTRLSSRSMGSIAAKKKLSDQIERMDKEMASMTKDRAERIQLMRAANDASVVQAKKALDEESLDGLEEYYRVRDEWSEEEQGEEENIPVSPIPQGQKPGLFGNQPE